MTLFWIFIVLLAVLATAALLLPIFAANRRRGRVLGLQASSESLSNIALYADRKAELDDELSSGHIDNQQYEIMIRDLDESLLEDDLAAGAPSADLSRAANPASGRIRAGSGGFSFGLLVALIAVVPLAAVTVYLQIGSSSDVSQAQWLSETRELLATANVDGSGDVETALSILKSRLDESPDNPEGWLLLGRTQTALKRYSTAADSYSELAVALENVAAGDAMMASAWGLRAEALFFRDNTLSNSVKAALDKALALNPDELNSLSLLGIVSFQGRQYKAAADFWSRILELNPESEDASVIRDGIARARQLGAQANAGGAQDAQNVAADEDASSVLVQVSIGEDLAAKSASAQYQNATLFVLAKAPDGKGPPMPLAVVKLNGSDLPAAVTLSDKDAMTPAAKLSMFGEVDLIARLSSSGSPIASTGDLEGRIEAFELKSGKQPVALVIDRVIDL